MRHIKLVVLVVLVLCLAGCWDDGYHDGNGGGGSRSGEAYWNTIETLSAKGYVPDPELAVVIILGGLYGWKKRSQEVLRV